MITAHFGTPTTWNDDNQGRGRLARDKKTLSPLSTRDVGILPAIKNAVTVVHQGRGHLARVKKGSTSYNSLIC